MRFIITFLLAIQLSAREYKAANDTQLRALVGKLKAGDTVILSGVNYRAGITFSNISGTADKPVIIKGTDKTVFAKGRSGIHLVNCRHFILENITVKDIAINGINIDDGGSQKNPPVGIILKNVKVFNVGPKGNFDGIKMSGLKNFTLINCTVSGWGGSAVDMVGCHDGIVRECRFIGKDGFSQSTGIQMKGGSSGVKIIKCFFDNAGQRAINAGGSTGLEWFRPKGADYEAKDLDIAGNIFKGSMASIAWATSKNCSVHHNTFIKQDKWILRILQETKDPHFIKCQTGRFENNVVVFDRKVRTFVNVGAGTKPETFIFKNNLWFDSEGKRKPSLPTKESGGTYNQDPQLDNSFKVKNPALKSKYGADAYEEN